MTATGVQRSHAGRATSSGAPPLLVVRDLSVAYGSFKVLRGVSLAVPSRGVHGVIGPNGAGKTTLFNALSGFARPSGGVVRFDDAVVTGVSADRLARLGLARSFQICSIFPNLTVAENLRMALERDRKGAALFRGRAVREAMSAPVAALLKAGGMDTHADTRASDLSYGRRRLLELLTTMALRPKLLLLDEPMAGLAHEDIGPVTDLVARAAGECGVLLVEHNLKVVETLAQCITVMAEGTVLCEGTYGEVARDPRVITAYIGGRHDGND